MRVWIVNQHTYTPEQSAGVRHHSLAKELIVRGHDVLIVATSFYHKAHTETRLGPGETWRKEEVAGVPFMWLKTPPYSGNGPRRFWNQIVFSLRAWLRTGLKDEPRPDVVIGSSPHLFAALAAERLARRFGVPFVFEMRDLWPRRIVETGGLGEGHPLIRLMAWVERYLHRNADHIVSAVPISPTAMAEIERHVRERGGSTERLTWLPNGADLAAGDAASGDGAAAPDPAAPPEASGERGAPVQFTYAGAHSDYADLDLVLDAAKMLEAEGWADRVRIRLVGDGPEKARLQARAADEHIALVRFDDPVPRTEVAGVLRDADVCLMTCKEGGTARWATSPNKLYEYMSVRRPVLYAMGAEYSPVDAAGAGISVEPSDARAIAEAIKQFASATGRERERMGQNGRAYVETYHGFGRLGEKLEALLLSLTR